jgi:hypothetical protein
MNAFAFGLAAAALGGTLFFAAVLAPTVFSSMRAAQAGRFLRALFPGYYVAFGIVRGAAAACAAAAAAIGSAAILMGVAAGFALARQGLMPRINALRDRSLAGDAAAGKRFDRLRRSSVALNGVQIAALALAAVWLAR